jgi:hypothetical protein
LAEPLAEAAARHHPSSPRDKSFTRAGGGAFLLVSCTYTAVWSPVFLGDSFDALIAAFLRAPMHPPVALIGSSGFNPLAALDPVSPHFFLHASAIAEALVRLAESGDPFWNISARNLVLALVMWEAKTARAEARMPLLKHVRGMLTGDLSGHGQEDPRLRRFSAGEPRRPVHREKPDE